MNVNLVVTNAAGNDVWLDLYEEQPIKLTFNIEDITTGTPKAEFTRKFRLPATQTNYDFFTTAFEIIGVDYNPGIKYTARIVVDGTDFRQGELRLQNIYRNDVTGKVDYACVFIGSAKGLSSEIGEKTIGDIDWSDYTAVLSLADITGSWEATPETPGNQTAGLQNGNLLFPIVDFGNTYTGNVTNQTRIAIGHPSADGGSFDQSNHPLEYNRIKPMVRMREIMRRMFEDNGFSFTGTFLTTNSEVARMYISAWGDDEIILNEQNSELARSERNFSENIFFNEQGTTPTFPTIINDPGGNMNVNGYYIIPAVGTYGGNVQSNMSFEHINNTSAQWTQQVSVGNNVYRSYRYTLGPGSGTCTGFGTSFTVEEDSGAGYVTIYDTNTGIGGAPICGWNGAFIEDGNEVYIYDWTLALSISQPFTALQVGSPFVSLGPPILTPTLDVGNTISVDTGFLEITNAVGEFAIGDLFNNKYKQLDLLKDVFTMFRLVMVPDPLNTSNFLIIPWTDYIGRGELKDWSNKLVKNKDVIIRPLILDQTDRVKFTMDIDGDYYNTENQLIFDEVFGTKRLDSVYDILQGEKEYKVKLAATPASQIEGYTADWDDFFVPQIHTREVNNDGVTIYKPIKPKTRILYYNGLKSTNGDPFYIEDETSTTVSFTDFPVVSYSTQMPQTGPNNRSMTFEKEVQFDQSGNVLNIFGQDLYGRYWSNYMGLLYNKDSRRVTAYFVLNTDDIINFRYNDVIYVEGVYYYIEKIYDAPLGKKAEVKVDLITLKNYRPQVTPVPPATFTLWENVSEQWQLITDNWEDV